MTMTTTSILSKAALLPALAAAAALVVACASLGSPEDQSTAASLWRESQGYTSWGRFAGHSGIEPGKSPHGKFISTYVQQRGATAKGLPPYGTIVLKENYRSQDPGSLDSLTVMKRIEGFDPENGDWFWARYTPSGKLTHAGKVAMCSDCHFDAGGDDFLFLNDR